MIFDEGFLKKYQTLRKSKPSIYNLEDLYYKVLPITLKDDKIFLGDADLTNETHITLNFPEFLDVSTNLSLIKSIHFALDASFNGKDELSDEGGDLVRLLLPDTPINSILKNTDVELQDLKVLPLPPDIFKLYLGYRHTPVIDRVRHLEGIESLSTKLLAKMEDDCFNWIEVDPGEGIKTKTEKTSVLKFKVVFDLDVLRQYIEDQFPSRHRERLLKGLDTKELFLNFIVHPPYIGRMSFKNSITILYPQRTTKLKMLDKITFRVNKSYVTNSKFYQILILEKDTDRELYKFDSVKDKDLFTSMKYQIDNSQINSYFDRNLETFEDSVVVDFNVPAAIQLHLSEHRNFKIRIKARDLTTQERG